MLDIGFQQHLYRVFIPEALSISTCVILISSLFLRYFLPSPTSTTNNNPPRQSPSRPTMPLPPVKIWLVQWDHLTEYIKPLQETFSTGKTSSIGHPFILLVSTQEWTPRMTKLWLLSSAAGVALSLVKLSLIYQVGPTEVPFLILSQPRIGARSSASWHPVSSSPVWDVLEVQSRTKSSASPRAPQVSLSPPVLCTISGPSPYHKQFCGIVSCHEGVQSHVTCHSGLETLATSSVYQSSEVCLFLSWQTRSRTSSLLHTYPNRFGYILQYPTPCRV